MIQTSAFDLTVSLMADYTVESCPWSAGETFSGENKEDRQVEKGEEVKRKGDGQTKAPILKKHGQQQELSFVSEPLLIF